MGSMTSLPEELRPREKALRKGISSLSDAELLALLIRTGTKERNAVELSMKILSESGGLSGLESLSAHQLEKDFSGISVQKALSIVASFELSRRLEESKTKRADGRERVEKEGLSKRMTSLLGNERVEHLLIVGIDRNSCLEGERLLAKGNDDCLIVSPKEIIRLAVSNGWHGFYLIHNHPGGSVEPSENDIRLTATIAKVSKALGIRFVDHLIVAKGTCLSMRDGGRYFPSIIA